MFKKTFTYFVDLQRKKRGRNDFSHFTIFRNFLVFFFPLSKWGFRIQQILRKWRQIGASTIFRIHRVFATVQFFLSY